MAHYVDSKDVIKSLALPAPLPTPSGGICRKRERERDNLKALSSG